MCDFKTDEHRMTNADVRRIAKEVVWQNAPIAAFSDARAITSVALANDRFQPTGDYRLYWQPDLSDRYNDRHVVTDEQFDRVVAEVTKQTERIRKLLSIDAATSDRLLNR